MGRGGENGAGRKEERWFATPKLPPSGSRSASDAGFAALPCRRLFANRGSEHMDLRNKFVGKTPPRRRLTNATYDE